MALKRHYTVLDHVVVALAAMVEGDQVTAEEHLQKALEDEDELREALEDVESSQEENLVETSSDDEDDEETTDEDDSSDDDSNAEVSNVRAPSDRAARIRANMDSI